MADVFMPLEELLLVAGPEYNGNRLRDILYCYNVLNVICFILNVIYHFNIICIQHFLHVGLNNIF